MSDDTKDKRAILNLYAAFGVTLVLSVVPSVTAALVSLVFFVGVVGVAFRFLKAAEPESLMENHATFILRTIGISTLFSLITLTAGIIYMIPSIDYSAFEPCANALTQKGESYAQSASFTDVYASAEPCMEDFIDMNLRILTIAALIAAVPVVPYLLMRYARGLSRAVKGYRLANPKSWF
jgi:uncharacterized membrane protein